MVNDVCHLLLSLRSLTETTKIIASKAKRQTSQQSWPLTVHTTACDVTYNNVNTWLLGVLRCDGTLYFQCNYLIKQRHYDVTAGGVTINTWEVISIKSGQRDIYYYQYKYDGCVCAPVVLCVLLCGVLWCGVVCVLLCCGVVWCVCCVVLLCCVCVVCCWCGVCVVCCCSLIWTVLWSVVKMSIISVNL